MTTRTDNFNRSNTTSAIGTPSDGGSAWVQLAGVWGITSNQGYKSDGASNGFAVLEASAPNATIEVQISGGFISDSRWTGIVFRASDSSHLFLYMVYQGPGEFDPTLVLYVDTGSGLTELTRTTTANVSNAFKKVTVDGSNNITCYYNGVSKLTYNSSANASNTKHGIAAYDPSASFTFEDFSITNTSGGDTLMAQGIM